MAITAHIPVRECTDLCMHGYVLKRTYYVTSMFVRSVHTSHVRREWNLLSRKILRVYLNSYIWPKGQREPRKHTNKRKYTENTPNRTEIAIFKTKSPIFPPKSTRKWVDSNSITVMIMTPHSNWSITGLKPNSWLPRSQQKTWDTHFNRDAGKGLLKTLQ